MDITIFLLTLAPDPFGEADAAHCTAESMLERILPVTRLRALALEVGPEADHAGFREFLADGNAR